MTGIPGRSRGCMTCRQRRIKCDLAVPSCSQCQRLKRPCPGPRTGPLFVNMTIPSRDRQNQVSRQSAPSRLPPTSPQLGRSLFEQLFVSSYLQSYGITRDIPNSPFWLTNLPTLLGSAQTPTPTNQCIRAVGLLFYSNLTNNPTLRTEAFRWYGAALRSLAFVMCKTVTRDNRSGSISKLNERLTCAPVMLFYFEVMTNGPINAWVSHLAAAAMVLKRQGPDQCSTGLTRQMFMDVRLFTAIVQLLAPTNGLQVFTLDEWLNIPFLGTTRTTVDRLVDLFLSFPANSSSNSKISTPDRPGTSSSAHSFRVNELENYISELEDWWMKNRSEAPSSNDQKSPEPSEDIPEVSYASRYRLKGPFALNLGVVRFAALYHSFIVVALSKLSHLRRPPSTLLYRDRIEFHCSEVIAASDFVKSRCSDTPGSGSMFLINFPLKIVSLWSPSPPQREYAHKERQEWLSTLMSRPSA